VCLKCINSPKRQCHAYTEIKKNAKMDQVFKNNYNYTDYPKLNLVSAFLAAVKAIQANRALHEIIQM
jgi:hypothetical protein